MADRVSFFKLKVGARFWFRDKRAASERYNVVLGPFVKIRDGTYRCVDGTIMPHTDGTYVVEPLPETK